MNRAFRPYQVLAVCGVLILITSFFLPFRLFDFKLHDLGNHEFSFDAFKNNSATAVIFLLSDCPASQSYTLTLNKLAKKYSAKKISFVGVFPGKYSTDEELKNFQKNSESLIINKSRSG